MSTSLLDKVGRSHGTDESSAHHNYLRHYEAHMGLLRPSIQTLLEVGVFDRAFIRMWNEFLSDTQIIGLDVHSCCKALEGPNVTVEPYDQSNVI